VPGSSGQARGWRQIGESESATSQATSLCKHGNVVRKTFILDAPSCCRVLWRNPKSEAVPTLFLPTKHDIALGAVLHPLRSVILGPDPRIQSQARQPSQSMGTKSRQDITKSASYTKSHPRPLVPCLQSLRSVTDTPAVVPARRDRRWWWREDVTLHHRGPRKMVSLRRHGGSGKVFGPACRF